MKESGVTTERGLASAVVVHYGRREILTRLLETLAAHPDARLLRELIVVDNTRELSAAALAAHASSMGDVDLVLETGRSPSYSSAVNAGVSRATTGVLIVMNNDLEWTSDGSLAPLLKTLETPDVGVAGPALVYPNGGWQRASGRVPSALSALRSLFLLDTLAERRAGARWSSGGPRRVRRVEYVDGACMAIRRECFRELGGFDESFRFYAEDADFCLRARRGGWSVVLDERAVVAHSRGASSTAGDVSPEYERRLLRAKTDLVRKHAGPARARLYASLLRASLAVRALLTTALAAIRPSEAASERARRARARLRAVRGACEPAS
ncbi:MAG: glycosyltransferase [Candidatus Eisenbacteria bacterium]|nr:glycosyltransferase [Candidatus Eisenbacteria bacterium]